MVNISFIIPSNGHLDNLDKLLGKFNNTGLFNLPVQVLVIDNCNTRKNDVEDLVYGYPCTNLSCAVLPHRHGLTSVYHIGYIYAQYPWICYLNDDIIPDDLWLQNLNELLVQVPNKNIYLLSHPNNWSGFLVHRNFIKQYPFNLEFPEGYYEDDDIYLRVAYANGLKTKKDVYNPYSGPIYCAPGGFKPIFWHVPGLGNQPPHRWDQMANKRVFDKYWIECDSKHEDAIENKDGRYYRPSNLTKTLFANKCFGGNL